MENTFDKTALETIDLLEARLRRIEYTITGHAEEAGNSKASVTQRLFTLEHSLHQLASKSKVVQDLLRLHSRHPDLFQSVPFDEIPSTLDTASLLSIVMASVPSYSATASRLTSVMDVPVPSTEVSAQLIELQPRIAKIEALQTVQNADIAELRERSAAVVQRWYTRDVLGAGDGWAEVEKKVVGVEQRIRRVALARRMDEGL